MFGLCGRGVLLAQELAGVHVDVVAEGDAARRAHDTLVVVAVVRDLGAGEVGAHGDDGLEAVRAFELTAAAVTATLLPVAGRAHAALLKVEEALAVQRCLALIAHEAFAVVRLPAVRHHPVGMLWRHFPVSLRAIL